MFAPLRTWRKWHRKINVTQKRHAVASALAASAVGPLVQARGHRCDNVPELPLVVQWNSDAEDKTADLLAVLNAHGVGDDLHRVRSTKTNRAGNGKMRGSRFVLRKGPLVVHGNNDSIKRVARNLPGVDTCSVHRLNLLQLAPGGHLGRLVVFTSEAFAALNSVFGNGRDAAEEKSGYRLQRNFMACADLARIINSDQVQSKLREVRTSVRAHDKTKRNPLKNRAMMQRLNPAAAALAKVKAAAGVKRSVKENRKLRAVRSGRFNQVQQELEDSFQAAHQVVLDEIKAGLYNQDDSEEEEDDE
jgi:large subunit ribosomal protein L4e